MVIWQETRYWKHLGKLSRSVSRKSDLAGRLGGEEFSFFLPNTTVQQSIIFSNRLLKSISQSVIHYMEESIQYTASIGLISSPETTTTDIEELMNLADKALYSAKKNGRNQAKVFGKNIPSKTLSPES